MADYFTGEHKGVRWRGAVEKNRLTLSAGDAGKTLKFPGVPTEEQVKQSAEQLIDYSLT